VKIILQKSVERLGDPGDVADVADGYARNYLIPRGLAIKAEKGAIRHAESLKRAHETRLKARKGDYEALAARLLQTPIVVRARAGEEGKLFGSVTSADVAEALTAQAGVAVDRDPRGPGPPLPRGRPGPHGGRPARGLSAHPQGHPQPRTGAPAPPASPFLSLSLSTIVHMDLHRASPQVAWGVTRFFPIPPAGRQSTGVLHCSGRGHGRSVRGSGSGTARGGRG
jgi:large subunit ribosomal protein L9